MSTKTISGTYASGYSLQLPTTTLSITSSGYVAGHGVTAASTSTAQTVVNDGTIDAYEKEFGYFASGVSCFNRADEVINGSASDTRAYIGGQIAGVEGAGKVINFGTIVGGVAGQSLGGSVEASYVVNGSSNDTGAVIEAKYGSGVTNAPLGAGQSGVVSNFGTIMGSGDLGIYLGGGGQVTNGASDDTIARVVGSVSFNSSGTVINFGTIANSDGDEGVAIVGGAGAVVNGSTTDTKAFIDGSVLIDGGSIVNHGTIEFVGSARGYNYTVVVAGAAGEITNLGTIETFRYYHADGVAMLDGGAIVNGSASDKSALIVGSGVGIMLQGAGTVTNFGTIEAVDGDAVLLKSSADTLIVEAGSVFIGAVVGGGGTLDLANGSGTIANATGGGWVVSGDIPTATFTGFGTLDMAAGSTFAASTDLTIAGGQTLDLAGTLTGGGKLYLNGGTANIDPGAHLAVAGVVVNAASNVNVGATRLFYTGDWTQWAGTLSVAAGGVMVFTGATDEISGTLVGAGLVDFSAGAVALDKVTIGGDTEITATASATLVGLTTLSVGALLSVTAPKLLIASGGATLAGGGRLLLAATSIVEGVTASARLINQDALIIGAGALGGGQMTLVNEAAGTIEGDYANVLTIDTGANTIVNAGLIDAIGAGGVAIESAIRNTGTLLAGGGNLTVDGAVSGAGVVRIRAATADFGGAFSENVAFVTSGTLEMADSQGYHGTITGFSKTGATSLDLGDIGFGGSTGVSFSGTAASGVLTITDGTHTARITLAGNYLSSTFVASSDGHGGVTVVDSTAEDLPPAPSAPAFVAAMASLGALPASAGGASDHAQAWRTQLMVPRVQSA